MINTSYLKALGLVLSGT